MLDLARRREVYDELIVSELCSFMRSRVATFDAIISADTLVYFGMLDDALGAASAALRPAGVFIATFEALIDEGDADYQIQIHGRYAHRESYLRRSLAQAGFQRVQLVRETLEQEKLQDVIGYLVVADELSRATVAARSPGSAVGSSCSNPPAPVVVAERTAQAFIILSLCPVDHCVRGLLQTGDRVRIARME